MIRLLDAVSGGGLKPPATLAAFDPSLRSGWRTENSQSKVVVNTEFPLYDVFRSGPAYSGYLAETIIMQLASSREGEGRDLGDYITEVNALTAAWARVHKGA
jgi:hypothetical protein